MEYWCQITKVQEMFSKTFNWVQDPEIQWSLDQFKTPLFKVTIPSILRPAITDATFIYISM